VRLVPFIGTLVIKRLFDTDLPFGFNVEIGEIRNNFNISRNGSTVGGLNTVGIAALMGEPC